MDEAINSVEDVEMDQYNRKGNTVSEIKTNSVPTINYNELNQN